MGSLKFSQAAIMNMSSDEHFFYRYCLHSHHCATVIHNNMLEKENHSFHRQHVFCVRCFESRGRKNNIKSYGKIHFIVIVILECSTSAVA